MTSKKNIEDSKKEYNKMKKYMSLSDQDLYGKII